jgi:hypothetical protein
VGCIVGVGGIVGDGGIDEGLRLGWVRGGMEGVGISVRVGAEVIFEQAFTSKTIRTSKDRFDIILRQFPIPP